MDFSSKNTRDEAYNLIVNLRKELKVYMDACYTMFGRTPTREEIRHSLETLNEMAFDYGIDPRDIMAKHPECFFEWEKDSSFNIDERTEIPEDTEFDYRVKRSLNKGITVAPKTGEKKFPGTSIIMP